VTVGGRPTTAACEWSPSGPAEPSIIPLYHDPYYTFRFADDRIIPRFHLEGVGAGQRVDIFGIDPATGVRLGMLTTGVVGNDGWVDVKEPILVRSGDVFVVVPKEA
jgi:hypothetical protein